MTRTVQRLVPDRSFPGFARLSRLFARVFPRFTGTVSLPSGVRMVVDTAASAERWLMLSGIYHPALTRALRQHVPVGGYCLDAGANLGFFTVHMAHWVGPAGRVAAFEPNPAMVERIGENAAANGFANVEVLQKAVHDRPGVVEFYVAKDPAKSSLDATAVSHVSTVVTAEAVTLDSFVQSVGWSRVDAIKVDVEGNDCRVLLGAETVLERFRPFVVFEYKYGVDQTLGQHVAAMFERLGYRLDALAFDGRRFPFDWQAAPAGYKQVDVLCTPDAGKRS